MWKCLYILFIFLQLTGKSLSRGQDLTFVRFVSLQPVDSFLVCRSQAPDEDRCVGALGPRPANGVGSPGQTTGATVDDAFVDTSFCGVAIDMPGIWWWVNGTGQVIRASSCDERTEIKAKISVFTGFCNTLRCVTGGSTPDFECPHVSHAENEPWESISTAVDFPTVEGQRYYILVQQMSPDGSGVVWMNFREPTLPQNNHCPGAIGPLPRDKTVVEGTTIGAARSVIDQGYCQALDKYPGVWYQVFGTGGSLTISGCGNLIFDGIYFSVYHGANCDELTCTEDGQYEISVDDEERCAFGIQWPKTSFTFSTIDKDRYYIYVHFAETIDAPVGDFRIFVDDGENGNASSDDLERPSSDTDGSGLSRLGTPSWDRFNPKWSLTVNDQCLYEFTFQFEHDKTLPMGEAGFRDNCVFKDPVTKLPFVADDGNYYLDPRQHWELLPSYVWATTGFNHLSLDWFACGHRPEGYSLPHYDFSFFRVPPEFRANQMTCELLVDEQVIVPGEKICDFNNQDTPEGMGFFVIPSSFWNRDPVVNMPQSFRRPKLGNGPMPHIGLRSWDQENVPQFSNQWNDLALFMSSYAGDLAMWQAHVPYRVISGDQNKNEFMSASAQYFETTIQTLPDTYSVKYDDNDGTVTFKLVGKSGLCKDDFQVAEAFAQGANDLCADALSLVVNELRRGSFSVATIDSIKSCNEKDGWHGIWFEIIGNGKIFTLSTCHEETQEPTTISVFSGSSCNDLECTVGQVQQLPTCDIDDVRRFRASSVAWITRVDQVYRVLLAGERGSESYGFSISDSELASNTGCESAVSIDLLADKKVFAGNTIGRNLDKSCDNDRMSRGIWYVVESGSVPSGADGTLLSATTCSDETTFYSTISVFRGGCGALRCVSDTSYIPCNNGITAQWSSTGKETFYLFVHSDSIAEENSFDAGHFELRVTEWLKSENDVCDDRIFIDRDRLVVEGTTQGASLAPLSSDCSHPPSGGGVWYSVVGTGSGLRASTCFDETDHETSIHLFSGSCQDLSCLAYEGDGFGCGSQRNAGFLNWISEAGVTYYLLVSSKGIKTGNFQFSVSGFMPEANDKCEDSEDLIDLPGNTWDSTADFPVGSSCGVSLNTPGLWYTVDGQGKGISASVCASTPTFEAALSIFTGSCSSLECVTGSNYIAPDSFGPCLVGEISVSWMGEEGKTYFIFVHGVGGGEFELETNSFDVVQNNDFCPQAVSLPVDGTAIAGSVVDATYDYLYGSAFCGSFVRTSGVWYAVEGTGGPLQVSACSRSEGSTVTLAIFSGTCDNLNCATEKKFTSICSSEPASRMRKLQTTTFEYPLAWLTSADEISYILVHDQDPNSLGSSRGDEFEIAVSLPGEADEVDICEIYTNFLQKEETVCTCSQNGDQYTASCVDQRCVYCNDEFTACFKNETTVSNLATHTKNWHKQNHCSSFHTIHQLVIILQYTKQLTHFSLYALLPETPTLSSDRVTRSMRLGKSYLRL